jgi:hypothetical protein
MVGMWNVYLYFSLIAKKHDNENLEVVSDKFQAVVIFTSESYVQK